MLDLNQIGQNIARLRKENDMTQMALADKLYVSFQAISSWERGLTMPEIDKLADLADIFGCKIEDIIGYSGKAANKLISGQTPTVEELADIAPIVTPSKLEKATEESTKKSTLSISQLISLAPFISPSMIKNLINKIDGDFDFYEMMGIIPFLESDDVDNLILKVSQKSPINLSQLTMIAPFTSGGAVLSDLLNKIDGDFSYSEIMSIAPFLNCKDVDKLISKMKK